MGLRPSIFLDVGSVWGVKRPQLFDVPVASITCTIPAVGDVRCNRSTRPPIPITSTCPVGATSTNNPGFKEFFYGDTWKPRLSIGAGRQLEFAFRSVQDRYRQGSAKGARGRYKTVHIQRRNTILMNKMMKIAALLAAPVAIMAALPTMASAQAVSVAIANPDEAIQKSNAFVLAINQIKITHKATIDQFNARQTAINTEVQPLVTAFQTAQRAPNPNQAALQAQANTLRARQEAAQKELNTLYMPVAKSQAYAEEQIYTKLDAAIKSAMTKKKIGLVLYPNAAVSYQPSADLTNDIVAELNAMIPSVSITAPANWQPGQAQAAAGAAPAPAQPAKPQPQGR